MAIIPFQAKFDKDFPVVSGNAEYNTECDLLRAMDVIILNSGMENEFIQGGFNSQVPQMSDK